MSTTKTRTDEWELDDTPDTVVSAFDSATSTLPATPAFPDWKPSYHVELYLDPDETPGPWTRRDGESDKNWGYFKHYRDQGLGRTQAAVCRHYSRLSSQNCSQISKSGAWSDRVRAWDARLDQEYQQTLLLKIRAMAETHATVTAQSIEALSLPFLEMLRRMETAEFIDEIRKLPTQKLFSMMTQAGRVIPALMKVERISRGLPTEISVIGGQIDHVVKPANANDLVDIITGLVVSGGLEGPLVDALGIGEPEDIVDAEVEPIHSG